MAAALADLFRQFSREDANSSSSSTAGRKREVLAPTRLREALSAAKPSNFQIGQCP